MNCNSTSGDCIYPPQGGEECQGACALGGVVVPGVDWKARAEALENALRVARPYVESMNGAEHMMDGFGPRSNQRSDQHLEIIDAALNSGAAPAVQEWRTMESAPKDGRLVDLWCASSNGLTTGDSGRETDCWFYQGCWWRYDEQHGDDQCRAQVHNVACWMPLPSPPDPKNAGTA